jgi:hypothetical protein
MMMSDTLLKWKKGDDMKKIAIPRGIWIIAIAVLIMMGNACDGDNGDDGKGNKEYTIRFVKTERMDKQVYIGHRFEPANPPYLKAGEEISRVIVKDGHKVEKPQENPSVMGKDFLGWFKGLGYEDEGYKPYDFNTLIMRDTTIYARFSKQRGITQTEPGNVVYDYGFTEFYHDEESELEYPINGLGYVTRQLFVHPDGHLFRLLGGSYYIIKKLEHPLAVVVESNQYSINNAILAFIAFPEPSLSGGTQLVLKNEKKGIDQNGNDYYPFRLATVPDIDMWINNLGEYYERNVSITDNSQKDYALLNQQNANEFRIKTFSLEAIEISGSSFWSEGMYYRIY